ncbi:MAG TPA: proline iminopeptidase-family hydrolase [Bacteroidota bacterium]|nr:proline iminopeptidase-family hydrolase [Bacteroidota bacterium]
MKPQRTFSNILFLSATSLMTCFHCLNPLQAMCNSDSLKNQSGTVHHLDGALLPVDGGRIWYKIIGDGGRTPVILIHGGPGGSSYYLKPFEDIGTDRKIVRYDQLGGGKSDKCMDTSLFTINHFVDELETLRHHLGNDQVYLLGHSFGSIIAVEYYRKYTGHVKGLVLSGAVLDIPALQKNARDLVATLSDSAQTAIVAAEAQKKFDTPEYMRACGEFYGKYVMRNPVMTDLDSMMQSTNSLMYAYMQGPSEFYFTGTLKDYNARPLLPEIKTPVLYTVGEFDEAGQKLVAGFSKMTPRAKYVVFPGAAHMTSWDARDENVRVVRAFLNEVDAK